MRLPLCWPPVVARRKKPLRPPLKLLLLRPKWRQLPMPLRRLMPLRRPKLLKTTKLPLRSKS